MHTQHSDIKRMIGGQCTQSQHGTTGRDISFLQESLQLLLGISQFNTLSDQCQRALCIVYQFCCLLYQILVQFGIGNVRADKIHFLGFPGYFLHLCITGEVQYYRTRTTATGNIEGTADSPCDILCMANLIAPFGDRLCHTHQVNLLEGICTQRIDSHLTGNHHNRC